MQVKNISGGPRGIWNADGELVTLEAGEARDIDLAAGQEAGEWFEFVEPLPQHKPEQKAMLPKRGPKSA